MSIPIPEYIHEIEFKVSIADDMKSLTVFGSSVNFREVFDLFYIIDSHNNKYRLKQVVSATGEPRLCINSHSLQKSWCDKNGI